MRFIASFLLLACAIPGVAQKLSSVPNPSGPGSIQPNWSVMPDGALILSWIEPAKDDSLSLRYAIRRGEKWSEARTIIAKRPFFHHPAEAPEVVAVNDRVLLAHWIETEEGSEAEFLYVSASTDGVKWSTPSMAHKDKSKVQHGLASMVVSGPNEASILWLFTPMGEDGPAYLMRSVVDAAGKFVKEERLDSDVCTCCPTSVAKTPKGLLVAYRDHTPADIRDIAVTRFENAKWTPPKIISPDNWKIEGCPINAASVAARGNRAMVAWYTGVGGSPKVQAAFSNDGGVTFGKPVLISTGHAFGYASAALIDDNTGVISWLERNAKGGARVLLRQVSAAGTVGPVVQAAEGGQQTLGYPRTVSSAAGTFIAWNGGEGKLQTAKIDK